MDEKLILSVFNFPELYNTTLPGYRSGDARFLAWQRISDVAALPAEECKKKWKNLRDRYFKEVRQEHRSKQETGELTQSRWKYRQLLNFLQPFIKPRNGIMDSETINKSIQSEIQPVKKLDAVQVDTLKENSTQVGNLSEVAFMTKFPPGQQGAQMAQLAFLAKLSPAPQSVAQPSTLATRKRPTTRQDSPASPCSSGTPNQLTAKNRRLQDKNHKSDSMTSNLRCDEDEMFLLSFVPALKRLPPQKRCETKMKIQQIMYEAEFNLDRQIIDKKLGSEELGLET